MLSWLVFVAYMLVLTTASLMPGTDLPAITYNDKVAHFAAYFLFALSAHTLPLTARQLRFLIPGIALFGLILEVCQGLLIPGRHASLLDALANALGVLVGAAVASRYWQSRKQRL